LDASRAGSRRAGNARRRGVLGGRAGGSINDSLGSGRAGPADGEEQQKRSEIEQARLHLCQRLVGVQASGLLLLGNECPLGGQRCAGAGATEGGPHVQFICHGRQPERGREADRAIREGLTARAEDAAGPAGWAWRRCC
jgi:hypothetical protein